jgi:hypothetical protein
VRWKLKNVKSDTMLTIFVIVAALGLVAVVAVQVISIAQEAEARGCPLTTPGANASKGRCFGH